MELRIEAFFDFVMERESIRLRKEADVECLKPKGPPWTNDPILQTYKFTNVFRHHDTTSRILREKFYDPHFYNHIGDILLNCAIYRYFGTHEFASAVGWVTQSTVDWEYIKDIAKIRLQQKQRVFTGAYVVTNGGISAPKQEVVVDYYLRGLHQNLHEIVKIAHSTQSWEKTARWMMSNLLGFGGTGFMTKEVLLDTTYTGFWKNMVDHPTDGKFSFPEDWSTWTPIGPGARRGAGRVMGFNDKRMVKEKEAEEVIFRLVEAQTFDWANDARLAPHDVQFQLCEFDKYERVRLNQGRPRSLYRKGMP